MNTEGSAPWPAAFAPARWHPSPYPTARISLLLPSSQSKPGPSCGSQAPNVLATGPQSPHALEMAKPGVQEKRDRHFTRVCTHTHAHSQGMAPLWALPRDLLPQTAFPFHLLLSILLLRRPPPASGPSATGLPARLPASFPPPGAWAPRRTWVLLWGRRSMLQGKFPCSGAHPALCPLRFSLRGGESSPCPSPRTLGGVKCLIHGVPDPSPWAGRAQPWKRDSVPGQREGPLANGCAGGGNGALRPLATVTCLKLLWNPRQLGVGGGRERS